VALLSPIAEAGIDEERLAEMCHPPLDEGLNVAAERAIPARKPNVKIKVTSTIRAFPSPWPIEISVFLLNAREPVLPEIVRYSR